MAYRLTGRSDGVFPGPFIEITAAEAHELAVRSGTNLRAVTQTNGPLKFPLEALN